VAPAGGLIVPRSWIRTFDNIDGKGVSPKFCQDAIDYFERSPKHKINQPWQRYHQITNLHLTELFDPIRAETARIFEHYKSAVDCGTLNYVRRIETPSMSRYDVADDEGVHHFHSHADAWSMETASRQVSVIFYLNDVKDGGETVFDEGARIIPRAGRVLVFPSSYTFQHRGEPPISGSKYVIVSWLHLDGSGHAYTTLPLYV
jgi:prolyl 4-hydroxylase